MDVKFLYRQTTASAADPIGGKARALAALESAGFPIPAWFALSPAAFDVREDDDGAGRHPVAELSAAALAALPQALAEICPGNALVAVRSSAMEEDGTQSSFAGQLRSFLSVPCDEVPTHAAAVWQSAFSRTALRYRAERGLRGPSSPPAVLVQRMVDAEVAGVAFGADPVSGRRDQVVLSAVRGLGDRLVSGEVEGQTFRVDARGHVRRESSGTPTLSDGQAQEVAALARRAGAHLGRPQDIEWAMTADGAFFLLQSRPITSLRTDPNAGRDGARAGDAFTVWDNSNIVESYRGITGPLTFSFARGAYEGVYRQFCRILRVPSAVIESNGATFRGMLGWIQGRIYYNLLNWYRVLAMLPGYKLNRGFMEQMMGVKEGLPKDVADEIATSNATGPLADGAHALASLGALTASLMGMRRTIARFRRRLEAALRPARIPLDAMPPEDLASHYHDLEARLLTRWDAPLLNDFFCMIFYGILARLTAKWCGDGRLHDELLQGSGGMISAEPAARLRELGALARRDAVLSTQLVNAPLGAIRAGLDGSPELRAAFDAYLERFGERCVEELKLESPTLHDDPLPLLRAIGAYAQRRAPDEAPRRAGGDVEARLADALAGHPLRRSAYRAVLRQTRIRIRERENLRFERTRVFGRVRRIFVELGKRIHQEGRLRDPRDVFYLEVDAVLGAVRPSGADRDLQALADSARKAEGRFRTLPAPPGRFTTRGPIAHYVPPVASSPSESTDAVRGTVAHGLGCSPGRVRGRVRIVRDPRSANLLAGEILVAECTDPGWILLFSLASGLVVERGSPLSHSAIVARELGIPAVVAVTGATEWLRDGDEIELDGVAGAVRRLQEVDGV